MAWKADERIAGAIRSFLSWGLFFCIVFLAEATALAAIGHFIITDRFLDRLREKASDGHKADEVYSFLPGCCFSALGIAGWDMGHRDSPFAAI